MSALDNSKHEAFARALARGLSASEAYIEAGYKESRSAASRLSTNVNVKRRVAELIDMGSEKATVDVARVLKELGRIGFSDLRSVFTAGGALKSPKEWDDDTAAAISSVKVVTRLTGEKDEEDRPIIEHVHEIKLWDKNSALEKIAKHLGMFVDVTETRLTITHEDALGELE